MPLPGGGGGAPVRAPSSSCTAAEAPRKRSIRTHPGSSSDPTTSSSSGARPVEASAMRSTAIQTTFDPTSSGADSTRRLPSASTASSSTSAETSTRPPPRTAGREIFRERLAASAPRGQTTGRRRGSSHGQLVARSVSALPRRRAAGNLAISERSGAPLAVAPRPLDRWVPGPRRDALRPRPGRRHPVLPRSRDRVRPLRRSRTRRRATILRDRSHALARGSLTCGKDDTHGPDLLRHLV